MLLSNVFRWIVSAALLVVGMFCLSSDEAVGLDRGIYD
jgi:hypothetical protein